MEINLKKLTLNIFAVIFLTFSISIQANIKQAVIKDGSKITFLYSTVYLYKDNLLTEIDHHHPINC